MKPPCCTPSYGGPATSAEDAGNRELSRLAVLGARVEALLWSEEPPEGLTALFREDPIGAVWPGAYAGRVRAWFREQLLGPAEAVPLPPPANIPLLGSLATGGATGLEDIRDAIQRQGEAEEDANGR